MEDRQIRRPGAPCNLTQTRLLSTALRAGGALLFALLLSHCSNGGATGDEDVGSQAPDATPFVCDCPDAGADVGSCDTTGNRVPEADSICAGLADGEVTSGEPDAPGCPNTCSCVCYDEKCYLEACTQIAECNTCPVFR